MNKNFSDRLTNEKILRAIFIIGFFIVLFIWAYMQPFDSSPDERMRYVIPQYIYNTGSLPRVDDATIVDEKFGFSYAGRPMLSLIISAFFMKICSLFSTADFALLISARMSSVVWGIGFIIFVMKISDELFTDKSNRWFFIILTSLWPQCAFMFTYVNCDSIALFSVAIIIYYWIKGAKSNWKLSNCVCLAVGLAIGAQSYYNMYGYILCSAVFFILHHIFKISDDSKYKKMFSKGILIVAIVFVFSGWFFIRNAIIYNGDILGNKISFEVGNMYGTYGFRPMDTSANSLAKLRTVEGVIEWILLSCRSFIGCFGYMSIPLKWWMYVIYCAEILIGTMGVCFILKRKNRDFDLSGEIPIVSLHGYNIWIGCLLASCAITLLLDIYFSTVSYQPQGRYLLPCLIPFTYLLTKGFVYIKGKAAYFNIILKILCILSIIIFVSLPFLFY